MFTEKKNPYLSFAFFFRWKQRNFLIIYGEVWWEMNREIKSKVVKFESTFIQCCWCRGNSRRFNFKQFEAVFCFRLVNNFLSLQLMWYQNSFLLEPTDRLSMLAKGNKYVLRIQNFHPNDFGNYRSVALSLIIGSVCSDCVKEDSFVSRLRFLSDSVHACVCVWKKAGS